MDLSLPGYKNGVHLYTFLPISKGFNRTIAITRDKHVATRRAGDLPRQSDYEMFFWPYSNLVIRSHVHPKFAIFEAGRKLRPFINKLGYLDKPLREACSKIISICDAWSEGVPRESTSDRSYSPEEWQEPVDFDSARETRPKRAASLRANRTRPDESPTRPSKGSAQAGGSTLRALRK